VNKSDKKIFAQFEEFYARQLNKHADVLSDPQVVWMDYKKGSLRIAEIGYTIKVNPDETSIVTTIRDVALRNDTADARAILLAESWCVAKMNDDETALEELAWYWIWYFDQVVKDFKNQAQKEPKV
jgi:hypothetical protein